MNASGKLWRVVLSTKALLVVIVAVTFHARFNEFQFQTASANWPPGGTPTFSSRFSTWDIPHYLSISEHGYKAGSPSCAFYPLWPGVIHIAGALIGDRPLLAAILLTNALSLLGFWMLYLLVERHCGPEVSLNSLILTLAFPGALFFSFPYGESLFFTIVMLFFRGLELERWSWVASAGFLLPLARPTGVFVLLPVAWYIYERRWLWGKRGPRNEEEAAKTPNQRAEGSAEKTNQAGGEKAPQGCQPRSAWKHLAPWHLALWPLLGYASYFGLMYALTGNAFEAFDAQKFYPNSPSIKNIFNITGFITALLDIRSPDEMMSSVLDRVFFLLFLALLLPIYRLNKIWFFYVLPAGLIPALSSWFMSYRRYIMVLFPMFVVLALLLEKTRQRWMFWYYVALLAAMQAWAVHQFINFNWAG